MQTAAFWRILVLPFWAVGMALLVWLRGAQPATTLLSLALGGAIASLWLAYRRADRDTATYRRMMVAFAAFALATFVGLARAGEADGWGGLAASLVALAAFVWFGERALLVRHR